MVKINNSKKVSPLKEGDLVSAISISSAIEYSEKLIQGLKIYEGWGLNCKEKSISEERWGYLAGSDKDRFEKLHSKNPAQLTTFIQGGWGSARILERPQPWRRGWVVGFSDITSILLSRLNEGFDGCVHGPMVSSIAEEPLWSQERLRRILFGESIPDIEGQSWHKGIAKGQLVAANLTVATHLIGTPHMPDLNGSILVLEDIGEEPYRIDRMLTHWRMAGILNRLSGLCFGNFLNCEAPKDIDKDKTFDLEYILRERIKDLDIPVIYNLPVGHCRGNAALPLGKEAIINGNKGILSFIP